MHVRAASQLHDRSISKISVPLTFSTDSVVVIKDGYLVYEWYTNGYDRNRTHAIFSLGKTMINSLIGVMENEGLLRWEEPVTCYYPAIGARSITIRDLLQMSSGIEWIEEDRDNLLQSDPWLALYSLASYKVPAWVAKQASAHPPAAKFNYSSGDAALDIARLGF